MAGHLDELAAAGPDELHHRAKLIVRHFDHQAFERLFRYALVVVQHDMRLANRQLVALAAHRFDQDRQMQHAAAEYLEGVRAVHRLNAQGDVALQFFAEPLGQGAGW